MAQLSMDRGDDREVTLTLAGDAAFEVGDVVWFTAKTSLGDPDQRAVISKVSTDGGVVISGNTATARITSADTIPLRGGTRLFYDWQLRTAAGLVRTLDKGSIDVVADVTHSSTTT